MDGVPALSPTQRNKLLDSKTIHHRGGVGIWEQPPSAMSWLEEANFQMLRDHQCALVWVDACMHDKAFAKSWAFGSDSSKVQALQARCNHPHKHQSIAGVKEQRVYLSTLTAEYPPSLALQLAQIGIGRVSKTGSFRLALPLHSNCPSIVTLAPCRLPTCDGAGTHSSADWCLPKPEHPLQTVARPWLHLSANSCHVSWHTSTAVPRTARSRPPKA